MQNLWEMRRDGENEISYTRYTLDIQVSERGRHAVGGGILLNFEKEDDKEAEWRNLGTKMSDSAGNYTLLHAPTLFNLVSTTNKSTHKHH